MTSRSIIDWKNAGIHVDIKFLNEIRTDLRKLRAEILSNDMERMLEKWYETCDCGSEDGNHSDVEDFTYCRHTEVDERTRVCDLFSVL